MKKVAICVITRFQPDPDCFQSLLSQQYDDFTILVHSKRPRLCHPRPAMNTYINAAENRNIVRKAALTTDADSFLFVDDDVVLPPHALPEMLSYNMDIVGGWYQMRSGVAWAAGKYKDGTFFNFPCPQKGIIEVDMVGLGCILVSRKVLEEVEFEHGLDQVVTHAEIGLIRGGDSLSFAKRSQEKGFKLYITDSVICMHKTEEQYGERFVGQPAAECDVPGSDGAAEENSVLH